MAYILVTGGAGFIGSHLCERLVGLGHRVVCVDNLDPYYAPEIKLRNLARLRDDPSFFFHKVDIRDGEELARVFDEHPIRSVVHLAARPGVRPSIENPAAYVDVNVAGTMRVLECSRRASVERFVFASSSSVYGNTPEVPFREDRLVDLPISPYAASKRAGELLLHTFHHLYGFDCVALRYFTVYGPRQRPEMAVYKFTRAVERGETILRYGDGSMERDLTYVDDIVDGTVAALETPKGFEIINLGGARTITVSALIELVESAAEKRATIRSEPAHPGDVRRTSADTSKAESLLGFRSRVSLEEGVKRFVDWYRDSVAPYESDARDGGRG